MIVKTFTGPTLRDTLQRVRDAFGPDAVILDTQFGNDAQNRLTVSGVAVDPSARNSVSVTAACEPDRIQSPPSEGPKTLHLKGALHDEADRVPPSSDDQGETASISVPQESSFSKSSGPAQTDAAMQAVLEAAAELRASGTTGRTWPMLRRWMASQPALTAGIVESFATHVAETLPPQEPFLNVRMKGQTVLFVGPRGVGRSTALFKSLAARWQLRQRQPVARIISDSADHGQERLAALCQGSGVEFTLHTFSDGRLSKIRGGAGADCFVEYITPRDDADLEVRAKAIRRHLKPDVVVLVLSASGAPWAWRAALEKFSHFQPAHIAFTHWDECQPWWEAAALSRAGALLLSYRTRGFDPIEEIDPFTPADLRTGIAAHVSGVFAGLSAGAQTPGEAD